MKALFLLLPLILTSCTLFRGLTRLDEMSEHELTAYSAQISSTVSQVAQTAINEGDLQEETLLEIIAVLNSPALGFSAIASNDSYSSLLLSLTLLEINNQLLERGAYDKDGILNEQGMMVLEAITNGLQDARSKGFGD